MKNQALNIIFKKEKISKTKENARKSSLSQSNVNTIFGTENGRGESVYSNGHNKR